jgi:hypothetical protein
MVGRPDGAVLLSQLRGDHQQRWLSRQIHGGSLDWLHDGGKAIQMIHGDLAHSIFPEP